jgi:DNA-binding transcriptional LysR family regulator
MPLIGIRNELRNRELHIVPVKGLPITTTWSLIWLKGKRHSPLALAYLEFLRKNTASIVHEQFGWYEQY